MHNYLIKAFVSSMLLYTIPLLYIICIHKYIIKIFFLKCMLLYVIILLYMDMFNYVKKIFASIIYWIDVSGTC